MAGKRVIIKYKGSGGGILGWYILSALLIIITLGIYSPWAINNLYRYIIENIEVEIPE